MVASPAAITRAEFTKLLNQYPALLDDISDSKGAKNGQKTLKELDQYRYVDAVRAFSEDNHGKAMTLADVKALVEWKLRHGKFRPTLMNLVSSNDAGVVESTIHQALTRYREQADIPAALQILAKLKGIGPATASLLLAVHDPLRVIFFSDEAFYWLCSDSRKSTIKYNAREYQDLLSETQSLVKRLEISAIDVEKVAFVLIKKPELTKEADLSGNETEANTAAAPQISSSAKRKMDSTTIIGERSVSLRRSKRGKA